MPNVDRPSSRQAFPDQLRSLALLGIIMVNAPFLAISTYGYTPESVAAPLDWATAFAVIALAQGKFYLIFSFLFGYSANFIAPSKTPAGSRRFRRRLVGLALIGLAHAVFLFVGDILISYSLLGAALMLLFGRSDRTALKVAAAAGVLAGLWLVLLGAAALTGGSGALAGAPALDRLDRALAAGSFVEASSARLEALPSALSLAATLNWGFAFTAFALGLVAGRRRLLSDLRAHTVLWRRFAIWGLALGLPLQAWAALATLGDGSTIGTNSENLVGVFGGFATAPILAAGYVGALALIAMRFPRLLQPVQESGRASLTLYIGESVALSVIFCGYGFGLFGQLGAAAVAATAFAAWLALELGMRRWLGRFPQGPLETLLTRWSKSGSAKGSPRGTRA